MESTGIQTGGKPVHFVNFATRKLRKDLHYRLRLEAAKRCISMEAMMNVALAAGLTVVEESGEVEGDSI